MFTIEFLSVIHKCFGSADKINSDSDQEIEPGEAIG